MHIEHLCDHCDAIPRLAHWDQVQWAWCTPHLSVQDRIRRFQDCAHRGEIPTALVALVEGQVVGFACLVPHQSNSRPDLSPWLANVFVAEPFRNAGIGSALSERAAQEAARLGYVRLFLLTSDKVTFYSRLGWSVLEETTHFDTPATIMARPLGLS